MKQDIDYNEVILINKNTTLTKIDNNAYIGDNKFILRFSVNYRTKTKPAHFSASIGYLSRI